MSEADGTSTPSVEVPREVFLALVWLQAHYAELLNMHDGGKRRPVKLPRELLAILTPREREARERVHRDGGLHGRF